MTSERLKVLINSSTPIVIMETVEEMRAVNMVRQACSELNLAVFEWTIAEGLLRSGSGTPVSEMGLQVRPNSVHPSATGPALALRRSITRLIPSKPLPIWKL